MNTNQTLSFDDLLTDCERSMRYHQARTHFYSRLHLFIQFIIFAFANVSVYKLISSSPTTALWLFAAISLLALFNLVYNPAEKLALHKSLYRSFVTLYSTIISTTEADEKTLADWNKAIYMLYADEPPVYRALLAHCDNQVVIALGAEQQKYFVDLRWYHILFRNFLTFQESDFFNRDQVKKQAHQ